MPSLTIFLIVVGVVVTLVAIPNVIIWIITRNQKTKALRKEQRRLELSDRIDEIESKAQELGFIDTNTELKDTLALAKATRRDGYRSLDGLEKLVARLENLSEH